MTKEEAIRLLKTQRINGDDLHEAFDMAIKALEQKPILDKIKNEFIDRYPRDWANGFELGGRSCVFSLNDVLRIIDKYKAEAEGVSWYDERSLF